MLDEKEKSLKEAANIFLKNLLQLQKGEKFLIYADRGQEDPLVNIIKDRALDIGAITEVFFIEPSENPSDVVTKLAVKTEQGRYNAICELTEQTFYQTSVWQKARELNARVYSLSGIDTNVFLRCIGLVNHELMIKLGNALYGILQNAKTIQIITSRGTNISLRMRLSLISRVIRKICGRPGTYIVEPSGIATKHGQSTFVGGQLAFQGVVESIEGIAVIDGYIWPPKEIGAVNEPVVLKIKKGKVTEISGCPRGSAMLREWFDRIAPGIEHFCIGFNPQATLSGSLMEAERVFGYITIGVGEHFLHCDGVMKNPDIILDGKTIEQNGSFIDERLSAIENKLIKR